MRETWIVRLGLDLSGSLVARDDAQSSAVACAMVGEGQRLGKARTDGGLPGGAAVGCLTGRVG